MSWRCRAPGLLAGACVGSPTDSANDNVGTTDQALTTNGVTATVATTSDWGGGYCASVTLTNGSSAAVTTRVIIMTTGRLDD